MARNGNGGSPTLIHKVILGAISAIDVLGIVWLLTHDVTKLASRRGIAIDGTIIAVAVAYCVVLAAIHLLGIFRVSSVDDPEKAAGLRRSKLTGMGEMILFAGLLMILVGILILGPGVAVWSVLLALVLVFLGGLLVAVGINRSVLKAAITVLNRRRRKAQGPEGDRAQGKPQPAPQGKR